MDEVLKQQEQELGIGKGLYVEFLEMWSKMNDRYKDAILNAGISQTINTVEQTTKFLELLKVILEFQALEEIPEVKEDK